jgi:uncharacterized membrane protein YedE/YeeE
MNKVIDGVTNWVQESPYFFPCIAIVIGGFMVGFGIMMLISN